MSHSLERSGRVIGFAGGDAMVSVERASACGACGSRGTCASGGSAQVIRIPAPPGLQAGDRIRLSMPSSTVALGAVIGYLLPPVCLLAGAVIAGAGGAGDGIAVAGAGIGLAAGLLLARLISRFAFRRGFDAAACGTDVLHGEQP